MVPSNWDAVTFDIVMRDNKEFCMQSDDRHLNSVFHNTVGPHTNDTRHT